MEWNFVCALWSTINRSCCYQYRNWTLNQALKYTTAKTILCETKRPFCGSKWLFHMPKKPKQSFHEAKRTFRIRNWSLCAPPWSLRGPKRRFKAWSPIWDSKTSFDKSKTAVLTPQGPFGTWNNCSGTWTADSLKQSFCVLKEPARSWIEFCLVCYHFLSRYDCYKRLFKPTNNWERLRKFSSFATLMTWHCFLRLSVTRRC